MPATLTILVPVYNERTTLAAVMAIVSGTLPDAQIVYVDDGSTDGSAKILDADARPQDIVLHQKNGGKGSAIRAGLAKATGAYTVIQDADVEYDPKDIRLLLDCAMHCPGSAVFGSRFLQPNPNIYRRYLWGNKVLTLILNILYGANITDSYTCYKLLPTPLFQALDLTANGFELEAEICAKCLLKGIPIEEVPISYHPRTLEEGKKIGWKDAWKGLKMMVRLRWR